MTKSGKIKKPTMTDVAERAGVSAMTVSRALKTDAYIRHETREKIMQAVDELGYVFDTTASGLSSRKTGFVAMIIPTINNANFAETVRGVTEHLSQHGLQLLLAYTNYAEDAEERLINQLLSRRPEALVLTAGNRSKKSRAMLENADIPVIDTWEIFNDSFAHVVGFSNQAAAGKIAHHFHDKGCRTLAFVGGDSEADTRGSDRRKGFVKAVSDLGLEPASLIDLGPAPVSMEQGAWAARNLADSDQRPDAVMCVSDLVAFGFMSECQRLNINIPDDLLLAGFGAYDISAISNPTITTIDVGAFEIGLKTGELVTELLQNNETQTEAIKHEVEIELLERETTNKV